MNAPPPPAPKADGKPFPQPKQPALKPDVTLRREAVEREAAERQAAAEKSRERVFFIADPPVSAGTATVQQPSETAADKPAEPVANAANQTAEAPPAEKNAVGPAEILVRVSPAGIVIQGQDLDALDDFQNLLETLVQVDKKRGRRLERFAIKHKDADVAANMLKAVIEGGATVDTSSSLNFASMLGGGGPLGMLGGLLGSGGSSNPSGAVNVSGSGFDGTIVPDLETNELVVMATSESLDFIDALIKQIDVAESTDPQELPQARFIPVLHGKAAEVMALVKEQFAGQIYGEQTQRGGQQIQPQDIAMALLTGGGGRGGPGGGRGGFGGGGRGNQQSNMGEKKKIKISVADTSNSLIVTAPNYLFEEVKDFVAMVDMENVVPDATVRLVALKRTSGDAAYNQIISMVGPGASVVRVLPFNSAQLQGRGGMNNPAMMNPQLARGGQGMQQPGQPNQQLTPQQIQQMAAFNNGRGGGGNRGQGNFGQGGPGGFGGGAPGGFGGQGRGGGGPGGFGGGGAPGGFGGQGGRGGGGAPGGFGGGGAPGGFGGGRGGGGAPGGFGGGGGGRGGPGGGGIQ